jgi:hypothetical protein
VSDREREMDSWVLALCWITLNNVNMVFN